MVFFVGHQFNRREETLENFFRRVLRMRIEPDPPAEKLAFYNKAKRSESLAAFHSILLFTNSTMTNSAPLCTVVIGFYAAGKLLSSISSRSVHDSGRIPNTRRIPSTVCKRIDTLSHTRNWPWWNSMQGIGRHFNWIRKHAL